MRRGKRTRVVLCSMAATLLTTAVLFFEKRIVDSAFESELVWNESEFVAVLHCFARNSRFTIPIMARAWLQWHTYAATNAIPIEVKHYNIIYHVRDGKLNRYRIDEPGDAYRVTPYSGAFYYLKQHPERA